MTNAEFNTRLAACNTQMELATLADEVCDALTYDLDAACGKHYLSQLLDKGLDPAFALEEDEDDPGTCIDALAYAYRDDVLDVARMLFERRGVPIRFFSFIRKELDYNCFNVPYVVKLYLLASAYLWEQEETYIEMNGNLYEEMFKDSDYTAWLIGYKKLSLTPSIFKQIEKYDYTIEMLPQETGGCGCWTLHIFDKVSRLEVATYA